MELVQHIVSDAVGELGFYYYNNHRDLRNKIRIRHGSEDMDFTASNEHSDDPSLRWAPFSLWSESRSWVLYMDLGTDFRTGPVYVALQFYHHPGSPTETSQLKVAFILNRPDEWAALSEGVIRECILLGELYDEEERQQASDEDTDDQSEM